MNTLCTKLQDWGCDIPGAMRRFLDDEDLYTSCLDTMLADESFESLGIGIKEGDVSKTYVGNPFVENMISIFDESDIKKWSQLSLETLEGGRLAFNERGETYGE